MQSGSQRKQAHHQHPPQWHNSRMPHRAGNGLLPLLIWYRVRKEEDVGGGVLEKKMDMPPHPAASSLSGNYYS